MLQMHTNISPKTQAHIYATGLVSLITLGTFALIALCFVALWMVVQFATLLLTSMIEALSTVGQLYATSDPMIKFLILVSLGSMVYGLVRTWRK